MSPTNIMKRHRALSAFLETLPSKVQSDVEKTLGFLCDKKAKYLYGQTNGQHGFLVQGEFFEAVCRDVFLDELNGLEVYLARACTQEYIRWVRQVTRC